MVQPAGIAESLAYVPSRAGVNGADVGEWQAVVLSWVGVVVVEGRGGAESGKADVVSRDVGALVSEDEGD